MKHRSKLFGKYGKGILPVKYVFSKNNQVFLKKDNGSVSMDDICAEEWLPVDFQWIPLR